jgi:hypothetical protein
LGDGWPKGKLQKCFVLGWGANLFLANFFSRPPSPLPSPTGAGEGESSAALWKIPPLDWPEAHPHNQNRATSVPSPRGREGQDEGEPFTKTDLRPIANRGYLGYYIRDRFGHKFDRTTARENFFIGWIHLY